MKKWQRNVVIAVLVLLILLCIFYIAYILMNYDRGRRVYEDIKDIVSNESGRVFDIDDNVGDSEYIGVNIRLAKRVNNDIVSWIYIPDTNIDYPIVNGIDNNKYLDTLVDGSEGMNGTLFIDSRIEDYSKNLVIYGHNMKDGSMFHDLRNYENREWRDKHKTVYLSFEDFKPKEYKVVYVAEVRSNDEIYDWIINNDINAYKWVFNNDRECKMDLSKRIVALSTCKGNGDIRILVLIQEL